MNGKGAEGMAAKIRVILPVILRIAFSLVLWTLGAATMTLTEAQMSGRRAAQELPATGSSHGFHQTHRT